MSALHAPMKKKESKFTDYFRKLPLIRTCDAGEALQPMNVTKKNLNIPICDVSIDTDYEKNIQPNFQLSSSFVRLTKKIGDEPDISIDYNMEDEDLVSNSCISYSAVV